MAATPARIGSRLRGFATWRRGGLGWTTVPSSSATGRWPAVAGLRAASAGHLPPLLVTSGAAELLDVRPTRMLGAPPAPVPAAEWTGVLAPGATLLLYTDGLVESRDADLDEGLAALIDAAVRAGTTDPDELCDRLLAELASGVRADDVALLAITRRP